MSVLMDPLNLILLAVAAFIVWRFMGVLGQRTGRDDQRYNPLPRPVDRPDDAARPPPLPDNTSDQPAQPVWKGFAEENSDIAKGLVAIASASPGFAVATFLDGAKAAYELILEAFAKADKTALKPLLSRDVLDSFSAALDQRSRNGETALLQFIGVKSADLSHARLDGRKAQIAVCFVGEMISAVKAKDGTVIEGDPVQLRDVVDNWTFERDVTARDPNWKLVDTAGDGP